MRGALAKGASSRRGSLGSIEDAEKYLAQFDEIKDENIDISLEDAKKCMRTLAGQQRDLQKMLAGSLKAKQQSREDAHKLKQPMMPIVPQPCSTVQTHDHHYSTQPCAYDDQPACCSSCSC